MNKTYNLINGEVRVGYRRCLRDYSPFLVVVEVARDNANNILSRNEYIDYSRSYSTTKETHEASQYWIEQAIESLPHENRTAKQVQGAILNLQGKEWYAPTTIDEDNQHLRELQEQGLNGYEKGVLDV